MFNSIMFLGGSSLWITQDEATALSQAVLGGAAFVNLPRLQKTFNSSQIANIGPNQIFLDPKVAGGQFSFSYSGVYALNNNVNYNWNQGWQVVKYDVLSKGMNFDDYIKEMTL